MGVYLGRRGYKGFTTSESRKISGHINRPRIPSHIRAEVWERDRGKCVVCGSNDNLHMDHIVPLAKGGSATNPKNLQVLCEKHNLQKKDKIM
jgi:5-methylcytosine-specific restriction endonuclease McrA